MTCAVAFLLFPSGCEKDLPPLPVVEAAEPDIDPPVAVAGPVTGEPMVYTAHTPDVIGGGGDVGVTPIHVILTDTGTTVMFVLAPDAGPVPDDRKDYKAYDKKADEPKVEAVMMKQKTAVFQAEVKAVRKVRKAAKRASKKALSLDSTAFNLGAAVKARRFARLNAWAKKEGWNATTPPEAAKRDPRMMMWWKEWRMLKKTRGKK